MFRFIKGEVDTYTKVMKVLGLNMEPTIDLPNVRNLPKTMSLEGFYNILLIIRLHSFPKLCKEIIFIINGQCCVFLEIISSPEKYFDLITP